MEKNDAFYKSFPVTLVVTFIISAILYLVPGKIYGVSFALGSLTMLFTMSRLHKSSSKILEVDKQTAQRLAVRNYAFRFGFYAIILAVAALSENFDLLTTGLGLFLFKIVFYVIALFEKRGEE